MIRKVDVGNHFRKQDRDKLVAFMRENSFAILVTMLDGAPFATHLLLVINDTGDMPVLRGHMAKANTQWKDPTIRTIADHMRIHLTDN